MKRCTALWKWIARAGAKSLQLLAGEIGPRELAILMVGAGVYLALREVWPEGAAGAALITSGGLVLWACMRNEAAVLRRREDPRS
jgi:hypothetical protein